MKNKILSRVLAFLVLSIFSVIILFDSIECKANTVGEVQDFVNGIVNYKMRQAGASSVQGWIDGALSQNAGISSEWYILGLSQSGNYDFSSYESALVNYVNSYEEYSATSRQKYALSMIAVGGTDSYIGKVMDNSIGQQGIMSWVYGLHLLNNGYISSYETVDSVKQKILSLQLSDGGWAITGSVSDNDVTAMTIQALAPHYSKDSAVKSAVDRAISLLSTRQLQDGDYASYGVPNAESTAQVLVALSSLGIDGETDSRFIKNGNTLIDGLQKYRLSDGSFCHKLDAGSNDTATVQAFYSLVAYTRMINGRVGLYILDNRNPGGLQKETTQSQEPVAGNSGGEINDGSTQESANNDADETAESTGASEEQADNETQTEDVTSTTEIEKDKVVSKDNNTSGNTTETATGNAEGQSVIKKTGSYKPWAWLIVGILSGIACLILYLKKKTNKKNFLAVMGMAVIAIVIILCTDFQSTKEYYNNADTTKENVMGTVTISIRCDTVAGKTDSEYIPEDGIVLDNMEFEIEEGDTVYDILVEAARKHNVHVENSGAEGIVYIAGINYLYEFEFGEFSGWMYHVNGEAPSVGCDEYVLEDGDVIEWLYTCELGKDLE